MAGINTIIYADKRALNIWQIPFYSKWEHRQYDLHFKTDKIM
jgi:hypothetical protein